MKVVLFGATGMIGQAVLRECLADPDVRRVLSIGRRPAGTEHAKLRELVHEDLVDLGRSKRSSPATTPASSAWASRRWG